MVAQVSARWLCVNSGPEFIYQNYYVHVYRGIKTIVRSNDEAVMEKYVHNAHTMNL